MNVLLVNVLLTYWQTFFVVAAGNYTITYPKYTPVATAERAGENSTKSPPGHHLHIKAPELGRNFSLKLVSSPNLLSNNFLVLETFANGSYPLVLHDEDRECYFRDKQAAVSLCHGVVSIFFIHLRNPL